MNIKNTKKKRYFFDASPYHSRDALCYAAACHVSILAFPYNFTINSCLGKGLFASKINTFYTKVGDTCIFYITFSFSSLCFQPDSLLLTYIHRLSEFGWGEKRVNSHFDFHFTTSILLTSLPHLLLVCVVAGGSLFSCLGS